MTVRELVHRNRSYRRFRREPPVTMELLRELVDLARLSPSAANLQPLKYFLSADAETNAAIFPHLAWAGYLKDWPGPPEGERPTGYIVILRDDAIAASVDCDHGIAAQTILLGAVERGFGGCIIGSVRREELAQALRLAPGLAILLVIALGAPKESVVLERAVGDIRYWRDAEGVHHVPKRPLEEILVPSNRARSGAGP